MAQQNARSKVLETFEKGMPVGLIDVLVVLIFCLHIQKTVVKLLLLQQR